MLNYIWLGMIVIGVGYGALNGRAPEVSQAFLDWSEKAVMSVALPLAGMFTLMLGVMRLVEKSGLIAVIARWFRPLMRRLFPDVPADHPAMGAMMMNIAANFMGAGNAATPFGLRAMTQLEKLNPHPGTATNAMCTFLVLNTSALTLISTTGLVLLRKGGATNPTAVIGPSILATLCGLIVGLIVLRIGQRLPIFAVKSAPPTGAPASESPAPHTDAGADESVAQTPPPFGAKHLIVLVAFLGVLVGGFWMGLEKASFRSAMGSGDWTAAFVAVVTAASPLVLPGLLTFFILYAALAGVRVFEEFVEGAKDGVQTVLRIIPYLVGMIVGVGVLRGSGAIDGLAWLLREGLRISGAFPDLLPMVLMRPLSGSGSQAVLANLIDTFGANSYEALAAATMYGSTETTFYVLAVYFGSVGIRRVRHALAAGLVADAAAMGMAMVLCQWLVD
ncbi:MAG: nucleoside recognition domain-containing protein [Verrucomicrobiales bacterium]